MKSGPPTVVWFSCRAYVPQTLGPARRAERPAPEARPASVLPFCLRAETALAGSQSPRQLEIAMHIQKRDIPYLHDFICSELFPAAGGFPFKMFPSVSTAVSLFLLC